jgi:DNA internalization-related competence protein ComEC/Rec2
LKPGEYHYHNGNTNSGKSGSNNPPSSNSSTKAQTKEVTVADEKVISLTKDRLNVYFLNVGQGDSTFIYTPQGETILIDGGNNDKGEGIVKYLTGLGIKTIDVMIATHPDADHIGGLDTVLEKMEVKSVYAPKVTHTTDTYKDFLLAVKNEGLKINTVKSGVKLNLKDIDAHFVAPVKEYDKELNTWSAVLYLKYNNNSFLFTGDADAESEQDMIASKESLQADVLKVAHHGSKTSTTNAFLKSVSPTYAIISVGKNDYGHPSKEVLNALKQSKIQVYQTNESGTIVITSDGKKLSIKEAKVKKK